MAEALCGPSNPLQNLKNQTLGDRTIHQDRLQSHATGRESFRSTAQQAGALDHEFEAFQAGHDVPLPSLGAPLAGPSQQMVGPAFHAPLVQQPMKSNWAADFQKMQISSPQPFVHSQLSPQPALAEQARSQISSPSGQSILQTPAVFGNPSYQNYNVPYGYGGQLNAPLETGVLNQGRAGASITQQEDQSFQQIFQELDSSLAVDQNQSSPSQQAARTRPIESLDREEFSQNAPSEAVEEERGKNETTNPDELSKAAGQLLHSLKDEDSEKFQNSTFLALMRRLRDKEVTVQGDKIIEVNPEFQESNTNKAGASP